MDKIRVIPLLSLLCCLFIFCCIYQLSKTDCGDVAIYTVDTDSFGTNGNGIHLYTLQDFAANGWKFPLDSKFCKETKTIEASICALQSCLTFAILECSNTSTKKMRLFYYSLILFSKRIRFPLNSQTRFPT